MWTDEYLGLPWWEGGGDRNGVSCWGLAALVYRERCGTDLPAYSERMDAAERLEIEAILKGGQAWPWRSVAAGEERELDLVTFAVKGMESHVGIVAWSGRMLHVSKGGTSRIERYREEKWAPLRSRFLRHASLDTRLDLPTPKPLEGSGLIALPFLDADKGRLEFPLPPWATVADAVQMAFPGASTEQQGLLRVTIGDTLIPMSAWRLVRPLPGRVVLIRAVPGAGIDLRTALLIAVSVAAIAVSAGTLGPEVLALDAGTGLFAAGSTSAALAGGAIGLGGALAINYFVPASTGDKAEKPAPVYAINGFQNQLDADGPVPSVLGKHRLAPPYAALPYTEVVADQRYIVAMFLVGYGPYALSDIRLGRTPISNFSDVQTAVLTGNVGDPPSALYPRQVLEDGASVDLTNTGGPQTRFTAKDVTEFEIEVFFQGGLYAFNHDAHKIPFTVNFTVEYRLTGTSTWTPQTFPVTAMQEKAFWRTLRTALPTRGQYEIRITRTTQDLDDVDLSTTSSQAKFITRSSWSALRSFRPEYPLNYDFPVAMIVVRIRSTGQLNGTLDNLNVLASRICLDWDAGSGTWISRETQNPASLFRYALQGPENAFPVDDADIDLVDLQDWHVFCTAKGLKYNRVHDFAASRDDVLRDIAAAGRAVPHDRGDQWTVIIDRTRTAFIDHISPRNSWGFSGETPAINFPDAYRVKFKDETNDYIDAERMVPWPGFTDDPVVIEELSLPGKTNPDEIWRETRRRQYESIHRPSTFTVSQDFEHLATRRGDGALISHDVLDRTQMAGRVVSVSGSTVVLDAWVLIEAGQSYRCRFRAGDGTSILRDVAAAPAGETNTLTLTGSGFAPDVGNLAMFGRAGQETREVIIKTVALGDNLSGTLTLLDHAPEIDTLTDAEVPPVWDGRAGSDVSSSAGAPAVPVITSIVSSRAAGDVGTASGRTVIVAVAPGAGSSAVASYNIRYRLLGSPTWTTSPILAGTSGLVISGYSLNDTIEVQAQAVGYNALTSAFSASSNHVVGSTDPLIPNVLTFSALHQSSGLWRYAWTLQTTPPTGRVLQAIDGVRIRYAPGLGAAWGTLTDLHSGVLTASPWDLSLPTTDGNYTFGIAAVSVDGDLGTPTIIWMGPTGRNKIRNSTMQGATVGVSGVATMPTNWTYSPSTSGIGFAISAVSSEAGLEYVDIVFSGTMSGGFKLAILAFEAALQIVAAAGQTWTESAYFKISGGSVPADLQVVFDMMTYNSGFANIDEQVSPGFVPTTAALDTQRHSFTKTLISGAAFVQPRVLIEFTSGGETVNFTLRVGRPQMEQANAATVPEATP
jgi:hypothetical protein